MAKKRKTKAQKIRTFNAIDPVEFSFVNREFNSTPKGEADQAQITKSAVNSSQIAILASTRKDLIKTFLLASIILVSEAMLYLAWK